MTGTPLEREALSGGNTPLIELRDVTRSFITGGGVEVQALRGVSLEIYAGEFVAIIGQSGSGKSTLMNTIGCLDRPTSGHYAFAGRDIRSFDADERAWLRREAFGFVFQGYHLLGTTTALENVEVPAIYAGLKATERHARAAELLTALGLGDRLDHRPAQLSGGQQQRVSIARALMNGGRVILADEPTGALDSNSGIEVMALLRDLWQRGHTIILITHDAKIAAQAERQIEILDGRIVSDTGPRPPAQPVAAPVREERDASSMARSLGQLGEAMNMAVRSLKGNAFRTLLTLLGIVIGVGSVVTMLAIGEGARREIVDRISSMGVNTLNVQPAFGRGGPAPLPVGDVDAILELPNIQAVLPRLAGGATVRFGNLDHQTQVTGTSDTLPGALSWPVSTGVFFTDADSRSYAPVAVLGATVVEKLFPDGADPLGQYVLVDNVPFQVIGTLTRKGAAAFGDRDRDDVVFVPVLTAGMRLFGRSTLDSITVVVEDAAFISATEEAVTALLLQRHGAQDFNVMNAAEIMSMVSESKETFTVLLGSIAAISLLVGGIGVMNIMLVSVTERTREIGIRMATGARQSDILSQFLVEAIVVSVLGGAIGLALGVGAGMVVASFDTPVSFTALPMLLAFGCAAATGLVFGFAPARKAARLDPVVALASD